MEHSDEKLDDFYKSRLDPLRKCGEVARKRGYPVFALQRGGMCFGGPRAEIDYKMYGISRRCRDGLGGTYANSVYRLIGETNQIKRISHRQLTRDSTLITKRQRLLCYPPSVIYHTALCLRLCFVSSSSSDRILICWQFHSLSTRGFCSLSTKKLLTWRPGANFTSYELYKTNKIWFLRPDIKAL